MAFAEITQTGTDVQVLEVPWDKIFEINGFYIYNGAASAATVEIKDTYTYNLGSSSETTGSRTILKTVIPANSEVNLTRLIGEEIIGTLVINTDQQPLYVYVGIKEKGGE